MTTLIWLPPQPSTSHTLPTVCARLHQGAWLNAPWPAAGTRCLAVVPASAYQWHRIQLPATARSHWQQAAASLIEPALLTDAERNVFRLQPPGADGQCQVAVLDRDWADAATEWLRRHGLTATRWLPETALLPARADRWCLLASGDEWVLALDEGHHLLLDQTEADAPPELFRAALSAQGAPRECLIAAVGNTARAPLWLAALGVRAKVAEGLSWLQTPQATTPDLSPHTASRLRFDAHAWRWPLRLAAAIVLTHGIGLIAQTWIWSQEATRLRAQITQAGRAAPQTADARNARLARQLTQLADAGLNPQQLKHLEFDGTTLHAEPDTDSIDPRTLGPRVARAGGTVVQDNRGGMRLRFGDAK